MLDEEHDAEVAPSRRRFLGGTLRSTGAALLAGSLPAACSTTPAAREDAVKAADPARARVVVSTWKMGRAANEVAWATLIDGGGHPLDACEAGVRVTEADPSTTSVGYGGRPNANGVVELDSSIMRGDTLECGSVAALQNIRHPVTVARAVMEQTPHVLLAGDGALQFARSLGIQEQEMLTEASREAWEAWKLSQSTERAGVEEDHDTLGMIVMEGGQFAMAVTTSGWAYKLPGRVGDSPIIGAGGYCDDEAGACVATGDGEEMIRSCASFAVVETMRRGAHPQEACTDVLERIARKAGNRNPSVALLAVDRSGRVGARSLRADFHYALSDDEVGTVVLHAQALA